MRVSPSRSITLFVATLFLPAAPATASTADWGYVSDIFATSSGAVLFNTSGARDGRPGCQGPGLTARYALDGSTTAGQAQVAILLNAYNMHKRIWIAGKNACTIWSDTETVDWFHMAD